MSDLMLYGVLRMPYDLTMANELSRRQFYSRVQEAASRLEAAEAKLEELNPATPPSPSTAPTVEVDELPELPPLPLGIGSGEYIQRDAVLAYGRECASAALINALLQADRKIDAIADQRASKPPAREAAGEGGSDGR